MAEVCTQPPAQTGKKRIPPHSEEAERGVLGAILLDPERILDLCIVHQITPDAFATPRHKTIYETLVTMHEDGLKIDIVTAREQLRRNGDLKKIEDGQFLDELVDSTATPAYAEHYIHIVHQNHLLRCIAQRANRMIDWCYDGEEDGDAVLARAEAFLFELGSMKQDTAGHWAQGIEEVVVEANLIADGKAKPTGVFTGLTDLDRMIGGLQPADMVVLAARPSMGKTALALTIAQNVITGAVPGFPPAPVAMFSLEMPTRSLVKRMICARAEVPGHKLRPGAFLSKEHHAAVLAAATDLRRAKFYIDDTGGLTVSQLRSRARRVMRRHDVKLIIVDYLQLLKDPRHADHGPQYETSAISSSIKEMAKELNIPVVVLSQLNRASEKRENRRPRLSDLRDSGSIEQDADIVCLLHRPCKHREDKESTDELLAIVDVAKHRNGETGLVRLDFVDEYTKFEDRSEQAGGKDQRGAGNGED